MAMSNKMIFWNKVVDAQNAGNDFILILFIQEIAPGIWK